MLIEFEEVVPPPLDEFDLTATNATGQIVAERLEKTDGLTSASLASDAGQATQMSVQRNQRISNFVDEGRATESFVRAYNESNGTTYVVDNKDEEDSDFADRVLVSEADQPNRINIQIRNLDEDMIAGLGRSGRFEDDRSLNDLDAAIERSIGEKAMIDPALKGQTISLLSLQSPIGQSIVRHIRARDFDLRGFKEVWISPFRERCIRLIGS